MENPLNDSAFIKTKAPVRMLLDRKIAERDFAPLVKSATNFLEEQQAHLKSHGEACHNIAYDNIEHLLQHLKAEPGQHEAFESLTALYKSVHAMESALPTV